MLEIQHSTTPPLHHSITPALHYLTNSWAATGPHTCKKARRSHSLPADRGRSRLCHNSSSRSGQTSERLCGPVSISDTAAPIGVTSDSREYPVSLKNTTTRFSAWRQALCCPSDSGSKYSGNTRAPCCTIFARNNIRLSNTARYPPMLTWDNTPKIAETAESLHDSVSPALNTAHSDTSPLHSASIRFAAAAEPDTEGGRGNNTTGAAFEAAGGAETGAGDTAAADHNTADKRGVSSGARTLSLVQTPRRKPCTHRSRY